LSGFKFKELVYVVRRTAPNQKYFDSATVLFLIAFMLFIFYYFSLIFNKGKTPYHISAQYNRLQELIQ